MTQSDLTSFDCTSILLRLVVMVTEQFDNLVPELESGPMSNFCIWLTNVYRISIATVTKDTDFRVKCEYMKHK